MPKWLPSRFFKRRERRSAPSRAVPRRLRHETLAGRDLFSNVPLGASVNDNAEFMLGDVTVNVVLVESNGAVDVNRENWTPTQIANVKQKIEQGMQWWVDSLHSVSPNSYLHFNFDYTYATNPLAVSYEPIHRPSDDYPLWVDEFLNQVGFLSDGNLSDDIRAYNNHQRIVNDSNWSFTIFVVNNANDADKQFDPSGSFLKSFAFPGGQFMVMPADRPASTVAHETGHMFWAADEYSGGDFYTMHRGYYDTQLLNAADGNPNPAGRLPSIMASDALLDTAFANHTSSPSTLAMIGWQDSDQDGIFDVLDVPLTLQGSGYFDEATRIYHFSGDAWANALPNKNTDGYRNDITINKIREIQYRVDGDAWTTLATANDYKKSLDLATPALAAGQHQIELRAIDTRTGVTSNIFSGGTDRPTSTLDSGIGGFVYRDLDGDGIWDTNEPALRNWEVSLLTSGGLPVATPGRVEPDQFADNVDLSSATSGVVLSSIGSGVASSQVLSATSPSAVTGTKAFANKVAGANQVSTDWDEYTRQLKATFTAPVNQVRIDAFGVAAGSIGRLEIYSASNELLGRYTTASLSGGGRETMSITRPTADIAYAIIRSHAGSTIRLDNLRFGPDAVDKTDSQGAYAIHSAVTGSFQLKINSPAGVTQTTPAGGIYTISPISGQPLPNLQFGVNFATTWQNILNVNDVDNDGVTLARDVLAVLQDMIDHGARDLPALAANAPLPEKLVDVNGDGKLTARDILLVIVELTRLSTSPGPEPGSANPQGAALHAVAFSALGTQVAQTESVWGASGGDLSQASSVDAWASWFSQVNQNSDYPNDQSGSLGKPRKRG